jgi:outer membrane protein assembly factor BamA
LIVFRAIILIVFLWPSILWAQESDLVILRKIFLHGNTRTKDRIILRELDIKEGDTLRFALSDTILKINRNRVYNTRLFNEVKLMLLPDSGQYKSLLIEVTERWYIFPIPIFELADRSFNEWWYNQNRKLNRINYGISFADKNFRGRKEELRLTVQGGFTTKLGVGYTIPYLNKKQTLGLDIETNYDQNKQVSFQTFENKQVFIKDQDLMRERLRLGVTVFLRKSFFGTHSFSLKYIGTRVADTVIRLNPNYFNNSANNQRYMQLGYHFKYDKRDVQSYAQKGYLIDFNVTQNGLSSSDDIHFASFNLAFAQFKPLGRNFYFASLTKGKFYTSDKVPYYNMMALGYYQDYVRGYDLYVVDAQSFALQRFTFRKKLLEKEIVANSFLPIKQFSKVPLAIYLNTYYDVAYAYSATAFPGNQYLSNEMLRGGGIGVDIVTYYDSVIRFEYSINKMLENRIYLAFTHDI